VSIGFSLDDLEMLEVKVAISWLKLFWKRRETMLNSTKISPWTTSRVKNQGHTFWRKISRKDVVPNGDYIEWQWAWPWINMMNMTLGHVDSSSLDLLPKIFDLLLPIIIIIIITPYSERCNRILMIDVGYRTESHS